MNQDWVRVREVINSLLEVLPMAPASGAYEVETVSLQVQASLMPDPEVGGRLALRVQTGSSGHPSPNLTITVRPTVSKSRTEPEISADEDEYAPEAAEPPITRG